MIPDFSTIKAGSNYASLINCDPPIVVGWTGRLFRFGSASVIAPLFRRRQFTFLIIAKGSVADEAEARGLANDAKEFMAAHPLHRFEWLCNIEEETEKLRALGLSAHTHNQNIFVRDDIFLPVTGTEPIYDGIYNARISPEKRNALAANLSSVAFITYRDPGEHSPEAFREACRTLQLQVPGARILNEMTESGCARLSPLQVNTAYAQAHLGLCLSPREGAMRVAIEYQMAGLPIVGTPCRGGRDHYFDGETWIVVPPDPQAIRTAVETMKAKAHPRSYVRARAMSRIEQDRSKFVRFVQDLITDNGGSAAFDTAFEGLLRNDRFERWLSMREFAEETWKAVGGD